MKYLLFLTVLVLLQSCGTNQFAKRKYTKGIYIAKHSSGKGRLEKTEKSKAHIKEPSKRAVFSSKEVVEIQDEVVYVEQDELRNNDNSYNDHPIVNNGIQTTSKEAVSSTNMDVDEEGNNSNNKLEITSFILSFVVTGISVLTFFATFIVGFLDLVGSLAMSYVFFPLIPLAFLMLMGIVTLVMGSISFSRNKSGKAKTAIILGALVIALNLLFLLITIFLVI